MGRIFTIVDIFFTSTKTTFLMLTVEVVAQRTKEQAEVLSKLKTSDEPAVVDRARGPQQRFSALKGFAPDDRTPVELEIRSDEHVELRYDVGDGEVAYESVPPGSALSVETYHGHAWSAYNALGELVARFSVDALAGAKQTFRAGVADELR